jgi:hypothetical protein
MLLVKIPALLSSPAHRRLLRARTCPLKAAYF